MGSPRVPDADSLSAQLTLFRISNRIPRLVGPQSMHALHSGLDPWQNDAFESQATCLQEIVLYMVLNVVPF